MIISVSLESEPVNYTSKTLSELRELAKEQGIEEYSKLKKAELIEKLV